VAALLAIAVVNKRVRNAPQAREFGQLASAALPCPLAVEDSEAPDDRFYRQPHARFFGAFFAGFFGAFFVAGFVVFFVMPVPPFLAVFFLAVFLAFGPMPTQLSTVSTISLILLFFFAMNHSLNKDAK
jgi:hypothetical protein